jgi:hypothetical protein
MTELISIGFSNFVVIERIVAIATFRSAPLIRLVQDKKEKGLAIDTTNGRKTKAVLISDMSFVILSSVSTDAIARRAVSRLTE